jgi:hypothetical protein
VLAPEEGYPQIDVLLLAAHRVLGGGLVVVGCAEDLQSTVVFGAELFGDLPFGAELLGQAGQGVQGVVQGDDLRAAALPHRGSASPAADTTTATAAPTSSLI